MYHIKSDRRSQASAAEIIRGLQECLKTTPLKAITVSDIHRVTGISRATFYRLFDTPEDVLHYQLEQMVAQVGEYYEAGTQLTPAQLLEGTVAVGMRNHDFLKALIDNGRFDLLYHYTEKSFRKMDSLRSVFRPELSEEERSYVIAHLSMTMVASQITWARNGYKATAADLVGYLKEYIQFVSGILQETEERKPPAL